MQSKIAKQDEISELILGVERLFPVEEWNYKGVNFWPILRNDLFYLLYFKVHSGRLLSFYADKKSKNSASKSVTRRLVEMPICYLKWRKWLRSLPSRKHVMMSYATIRTDLNGEFYNKFLDPLIEEKGWENSSLILEGKCKESKSYRNQKIVSEYGEVMQDFIFRMKLKSKFFRSKKSPEQSFDKYEDFLAYLSSYDQELKTFTIKWSLPKLKQWLDNEFIPRVSFFGRVLNEVSGQTVYTTNYYNYNAMAIICAANKRGLDTVEIQHGPQTNLHMAYAYWTKFPELGYDLLPRTFWCWDDYSESVIMNWIKRQNNGSVKVVGNFWMNYFKSKLEQKISEKVILYSLQPMPFSLEMLFPDSLVRLIKKTPFQWFVRLHPAQIKQYDDVKAFMESKGLAGIVNIDEASNMQLPLLLAKTMLHVTNSSGVALEASYVGIPNIFLHELAISYYPHLIDSGNAVFLDTDSEQFEERFIEIAQDHFETI